MKVTPSSVPLNPTQKIATNDKVHFAQGITQVQSSKPSQKISETNLISRDEMRKLSQDLKTGVIDQDEASRRFIDAIAQNSLQNKISEKDRQKLVLDISEFFQDDAHFMKNLHKNLLDLT